MTLLPRKPTDLSLAPVAVEIDRNLRKLRDADRAKITDEVAFALNTNPGETREKRVKEICELATRHVDLHGWTAVVSDDATRLHLDGGSVSLDVGLSASLRDYIESGGAG